MLNYPYIMPLVAEGGGVSSQLFKGLVDGSITSVTAEDLQGVTQIKDYVFYDILSLSTVELSEGITRIGRAAFQQCGNLTSITFPTSGLTTIYNYAFYYCRRLADIIIPASTTYIGDRAFSYCDSVSSFKILASSVPALNNADAFNNTNDCPIYVPTPDDYRIATNWADVVDANNQSRIFPLVEAETDLLLIDTNIYMKACVIEKGYKQYEYDGTQWSEVIES